MPTYQYSENQNIDQEQLITTIEKKLGIILQKLELNGFLATFFIEISLVKLLEKQLKNIVYAGHEVAFFNADSDTETIEKTKIIAEQFLQKPIRGLRQKYHQIDYPEIKKMNFSYVSNIEESSINFLWRKLSSKTEIHYKNDLTIIPESQSPYSQLPFNDFVFQVTPMRYYESMITESLKSSEYVMIYTNIWQYMTAEELPYKLPFYKRLNIGTNTEKRLEKLLQYIDESEIAVSRMKDYLF